MSRYDELRTEFIKAHEKADEFVWNERTGDPIQAIYHAPDRNTDYESIEKLLKSINGGITCADEDEYKECM